MVTSDTGALPDYASLVSTLQRCAAAYSPSEAHGFALGLLIAGVSEPSRAWAEELYSDLDPADVLAGECRAALDRLFSAVFVAADAAPMQLVLLLPQDIQVDARRLAAVRDWCDGFLFGFGLGGKVSSGGLSQAGSDFLRDITEFTRLDTGAVENSAENQAALIEIEEYLREGVLLLRDELRNGRGGNEAG